MFEANANSRAGEEKRTAANATALQDPATLRLTAKNLSLCSTDDRLSYEKRVDGTVKFNAYRPACLSIKRLSKIIPIFWQLLHHKLRIISAAPGLTNTAW